MSYAASQACIHLCSTNTGDSLNDILNIITNLLDTTTTSSITDEEDSANGLVWTIVGAVIGSLVTLALVIAIAVIVAVIHVHSSRRRRRQERKEKEEKLEHHSSDDDTIMEGTESNMTESAPPRVEQGEMATNQYAVLPMEGKATKTDRDGSTLLEDTSGKQEDNTHSPLPETHAVNIVLKSNTAYGVISKHPEPTDIEEDPYYSGYVVPDLLYTVTQGEGHYSTATEQSSYVTTAEEDHDYI